VSDGLYDGPLPADVFAALVRAEKHVERLAPNATVKLGYNSAWWKDRDYPELRRWKVVVTAKIGPFKIERDFALGDGEIKDWVADRQFAHCV
jgi:hypothetical protein